MNVNVEQKDKKYFDLMDKDNNQYRIFFRSNKNKTPTFTLCIVEEISPTKSISYKKTFMVDEFNSFVDGYKKFGNVNEIQNELMSNIIQRNIEIKQLNENTKLVNILLNNQFQLSMKMTKVHEIYESNILKQRIMEQNIQANFMKNRLDRITNNLQKYEEDNKNTDKKLQDLKNKAAKLFDLFYKSKPNPAPQPPPSQGPSEEVMLTLTKEERYRILGIKSDIVHTKNELFYLSYWLSPEKATKLDLLYKGPYHGFQAITFHSMYDNLVPCLVLIETTSGARIGGFTNQTWKGENEYKKDNTAFLFSLNFLEKYPVKPEFSHNAIYTKTSNFFGFGKGDLIIYDQCDKRYNKSDFPNSYSCLSNKGNPKYRLTGYSYEFVVKDLEVFLVSFNTNNY